MRSALRRAAQHARSPSAVYLAGTVLSRLGGFILIPLYTRRFTNEQYGEFALGQGLLGVLCSLFALGLNNAITKYQFDRSKEDAPALTGAVARMTVAVTFASALLTEVIVLAVHPSGKGLASMRALTCLVVAAAGSAIFTIPAQVARNDQRAYLAAGLQLFELLLVSLLGALFVGPLGRGLPGAFESLALTYSILGAIGIVSVARMPSAPMSRALLRESVAFALPTVPHYVAVWLQSMADRWVMELYGITKELGPYSLASQLTSPGVMIVNAWNLERSARTGQTFQTDGLAGLRRQIRGIRASYLAAFGIGSAATLCAIPVFRILAGRMFGEAFDYLLPLLAVLGIETLYHPNSHVAYYSGQSKSMAAITTASSIVNVGLSLVVVPFFGVWGALLARGVSALLKTTGMWWVARRILRSNPPAATEA